MYLSIIKQIDGKKQSMKRSMSFYKHPIFQITDISLKKVITSKWYIHITYPISWSPIYIFWCCVEVCIMHEVSRRDATNSSDNSAILEKFSISSGMVSHARMHARRLISHDIIHIVSVYSKRRSCVWQNSSATIEMRSLRNRLRSSSRYTF